MAKVLVTQQYLQDTADAIRIGSGKSATMLPSQFADQIEEIEGGVISLLKGRVKFYDYDGTLLYSYGTKQFIENGHMPQNPTHKGLISQGWNWSFEQIVQQAKQVGGDINVGQMYITASGATQIQIELDQDTLEPYLYFEYEANTSFTVDWGDQSELIEQTVNTNGNFNQQHIYSQSGKYVIKINVNQGEVQLIGSEQSYFLLWNNISQDYTYRNKIKKVKIGNNFSISSNTFNGCFSLQTITIPFDILSFNGQDIFQRCYCLKTIVIPNSVNTIGNYAFRNCYSLKTVCLPCNITSLTYTFVNCYDLKSITLSNIETFNVSIFSNCYSIKTIIIPNTLTSIANNVFQNCYNILKYHFQSTTPPTLGTNVFTGINQNCKIYVPYSEDHSVLNAYKTATNWSNWADYIQEEKPIVSTQAYAVFNSNNGNLTFFRDTPNKYTNGDTSGTNTYYTGIETTNYASTSQIPWYSNRSSVTNVVFEDEIQPISTAYWFYYMNNSSFKSITNLDKLDTSNVVDMSSMFYYCTKLTSLDVSHFDTSNVTSMGAMFYHCQNLTSLDVSHFDTSNVTSMSNMFNYCQNLTSLDVSHFDTSNVTDMSGMFYNCIRLTTTLNIANMPNSYNWMCEDAATEPGSQITLKYISPVTSANVDTLVATKSNDSNIINGGQGTFILPTLIN